MSSNPIPPSGGFKIQSVTTVTASPGIGISFGDEDRIYNIGPNLNAKNKEQFIRYYTSRYAIRLDSRPKFFGHLQRAGLDNFEITKLINKINKTRIRTFFRTLVTFVVFQVRKMFAHKTYKEFLPASIAIGALTFLLGFLPFVMVDQMLEKSKLQYQLSDPVVTVWVNLAFGFGSILLMIVGLLLFLGILFGICWVFNKAWDKIKEIA